MKGKGLGKECAGLGAERNAIHTRGERLWEKQAKVCSHGGERHLINVFKFSPCSAMKEKAQDAKLKERLEGSEPRVLDEEKYLIYFPTPCAPPDEFSEWEKTGVPLRQVRPLNHPQFHLWVLTFKISTKPTSISSSGVWEVQEPNPQRVNPPNPPPDLDGPETKSPRI